MVRDALKPGLIQQVENTIAPGTPDTYYACGGISGWLELKVANHIPARGTTSVFKSLNRGMELEQEAWIYQCARNGGNANGLVRILNRDFLVPGMVIHSFNTMSYPEFLQFEVELKDLKAILKFYATATTGDNHAPDTTLPLRQYSIWYDQVRHDFRPSAEGILL